MVENIIPPDKIEETLAMESEERPMLKLEETGKREKCRGGGVSTSAGGRTDRSTSQGALLSRET